MRLFQYIIITTLILSTSCSSVSNTTSIPTNLNAYQYNDLTSNYMSRPTYITLNTMSDGESSILIKMTPYGNGYFMISFIKSEILTYLHLLDKYDLWMIQANKRNDTFTKDIGFAKSTPAWGHAGGVDLKFTFHSGNYQNHYLLITTCSLGNYFDNEALAFDSANVAILRSLLKDFQNGILKPVDINDLYR